MQQWRQRHEGDGSLANSSLSSSSESIHSRSDSEMDLPLLKRACEEEKGKLERLLASIEEERAHYREKLKWERDQMKRNGRIRREEEKGRGTRDGI